MIQSQKTLESFSQFQPLFENAISKGQLGVCRWIESGTTIDSAIPEIGSLTEDKPEWRAVIVRYADDAAMAACSTDPRNPYDFLAQPERLESPVPLVRLTQMLGGVPNMELEYHPHALGVDEMPIQGGSISYDAVVDEQKKADRQQLKKKYAFDGYLPTSILLITLRLRADPMEEEMRAMEPHLESDSSRFWLRNRFPSICRFAVYDVENRGPVQKEADDFGFWYSVMLMCMNPWESSLMRAYCLYTLRAIMDCSAMQRSFQTLTDRLRDAKQSIEQSIKNELELEIRVDPELPDIRVEVPVVLKLPEAENRGVKPRLFPLLSKGAASDLAIWTNQCRTREEELALSVRLAERSLDQAAEKMRNNCAYTEDEVEPLGQYQTEDLQLETAQIYQRIVEIQAILPKENVSDNKELRTADRAVTNDLTARIMARPAYFALGLAAALLVLSALPALFVQKMEGNMLLILATLPLVGAVLALLTAGIVVTVQKLALNSKITSYNRTLSSMYHQLTEDAKNFTDYMSNIASHARGHSYINLARRKRHVFDEGHSSKYRHVKAVNIMLSKLRCWSRAYHLAVDFTTKRPETSMEVNTDIAPSENGVYALPIEDGCAVNVNRSGNTMKSPYPFASRIDIKREELYENG